MKALEERILREGKVENDSLIRVDGFLNQQVDIAFMDELAKEFRRLFADAAPDKIMTAEVSGIPIACSVAREFGSIPVVFARKGVPVMEDEQVYGSPAKSFTKGTYATMRVGKGFIKPGEKVLIIDDFLAHGEAGLAMCDLIRQAGAEVVGFGAVIEKQQQGGRLKLRTIGVDVCSLAIVKDIKDGRIEFTESGR